MLNYLVFDATGAEILRGRALETSIEPLREIYDVRIVEELPLRPQRLFEGALVDIPEQPSLMHSFDVTTCMWRGDLAVARKQLKESWTAWRDSALAGVITVADTPYAISASALYDLEQLLTEMQTGVLASKKPVLVRGKNNAMVPHNMQSIVELINAIRAARREIFNATFAGKDALDNPELTFEQVLLLGPPPIV